MTLTARLAVEDVPIDELRPDPANPRRIDDDGREALRSLPLFGFVESHGVREWQATLRAVLVRARPSGH